MDLRVNIYNQNSIVVTSTQSFTPAQPELTLVIVNSTPSDLFMSPSVVVKSNHQMILFWSQLTRLTYGQDGPDLAERIKEKAWFYMSYHQKADADVSFKAVPQPAPRPAM